ncbi:hypothetical protein KC909_05930 [Candidatus Dojkabacteria bacterium]|uniref:Uncharacterized protein n=1 Tax=Candidatus Dojkabacteria bacterium TaxID=2099670 RepID=A0A955L6N8_9BACT|nr:hypothetical protein [Candidatus Dojkabacteria bacterium]
MKKTNSKLVIIVAVVLAFITVSSYLIFFSKETDTRESCEANGGYWTVIPGIEVCNYPSDDAGKECTDSSQCEYRCLAPLGTEEGTSFTGSCQESSFIDCYTEIKDGVVIGGLCI